MIQCYVCQWYHQNIVTARARSTTGGNVFTGVCLFREGIPVLGSFLGLWSQILSPGGTLSMAGSTPGQGNAPARMGYPPGQVRMGYTPARTGVTPSQVRMGYPPSPPGQDRTAERTLATRWAVCLLRSRRTFLLEHKITGFIRCITVNRRVTTVEVQFERFNLNAV